MSGIKASVQELTLVESSRPHQSEVQRQFLEEHTCTLTVRIEDPLLFFFFLRKLDSSLLAPLTSL